MGIQSGEFRLGFHKVQHLEPAEAITVPEVLINGAYQFQILGRVQSPTILAVIHFSCDRDHFERFRVLVQVGSNVRPLILFFGSAPGARQGICGKHFNSKPRG